MEDYDCIIKQFITRKHCDMCENPFVDERQLAFLNQANIFVANIVTIIGKTEDVEEIEKLHFSGIKIPLVRLLIDEETAKEEIKKQLKKIYKKQKKTCPLTTVSGKNT